jgi:hypothetical protein
MRTKRSYDCHYYRRKGNGLIKNSNEACWSGIVDLFYWNFYISKQKEKYKKTKNIPLHIFIDKFQNEYITTRENLINVLNIINKITTCKLVIINNKEYIKYKFICNKNYEANLLLLNFIRLLWYEDYNLNFEQYYKDIAKYNNEEPFLFLTTCLKNNVIIPSKYYYGNHSHVIPDIIPKTFEDVKKQYSVDKSYCSASYFLKLKSII